MADVVKCAACQQYFVDVISFFRHPCFSVFSTEVARTADVGAESTVGVDIEETPPESRNQPKFWPHASVLLLIELYREHTPLFTSPVLRKIEVWRRISGRMKDKGYDFSAMACDKKFRALKARYNHILDNNKATGRGSRPWEFYDVMADVLEGDPTVAPVRTVSSLSCTDDTRGKTLGTAHIPRPASAPLTSTISSTPASTPSSLRQASTSTSSPLASTTSSPLASTTSSPLASTTSSPLASTTSSTLASSTSSTLATTTSSTLATTTSSTLASSSASTSRWASTSPQARQPTKKARRNDAPEWFLEFARNQNQQLIEVKELQRQGIEVARERNAVLKKFTEALLKK